MASRSTDVNTSASPVVLKQPGETPLRLVEMAGGSLWRRATTGQGETQCHRTLPASRTQPFVLGPCGMASRDGQVIRTCGDYSPGSWDSSLLFIRPTVGLFFTLVFIDGGRSAGGRTSPSLTDPLPRRFGQRMEDMRRKMAVICSRT